jgi:hypothetical protein
MTSAQLPIPETLYARSGDVSIAYQVMGEGPIDLVMVPGLVSPSNSHTNYPDIPISCTGSLPLRVLLASTNVARFFQTGLPGPHRLTSGWMILTR